MFVTATGGLTIRSEGSVEGERLGLLSFRDKVTVYAKSKTAETISDVTGFWYSISDKNDTWVFGGYLSEKIPSYDYNTLIIGNWDMHYNHTGPERFFIQFNANKSVLIGVRESGHGFFGAWEITGNIITARATGGMDYDNPDHVVINYTIAEVIDQNRMIFKLSNGDTVPLTRSNISY